MRPIEHGLTLQEDNPELIRALETMNEVMDRAKKDALLILCLQSAFQDSLNNPSTQELELLLSGFLKEDYTQLGIYYNLGTNIAENLTEKQLNIVSLLFEGNSQQEIADYLDIDKSTVSKHFKLIRKRISKKVQIDWSLI